MSEFTLKILACDRLFYEGPCEKFMFPAFDGNIEILHNHEQLTAQVCIGEIRFLVPGSGEWQVAVVTGGIVTVENNVVTVIVYSAERPSEIDAARAQAAKEKAEAALKEKNSAVDQKIATDSLNRAVQRLRSSSKI